MHHSSAEEDSAGELSAENEESIVPFEETGRNSGDEGTEEDQNQATDLDEDEWLGAEIGGGTGSGVSVVSVAVAAVGGGGGEEEDEDGNLGKKRAGHWD